MQKIRFNIAETYKQSSRTYFNFLPFIIRILYFLCLIIFLIDETSLNIDHNYLKWHILFCCTEIIIFLISQMADYRQLAHHPHVMDRPHSAISNICSSHFQLSASSHTARIPQSLTGNRCLTHLPHHAHHQHLHSAVSNEHN